MGNRRILDARYEEGVAFISEDDIKQACVNGDIGVLDRECDSAVVGGVFNIYFDIKDSNLVLLHIKANVYTVVDKTVVCTKTGENILLAQELARGFHFNVNSGEIVAYVRKNHNVKPQVLSLPRVVKTYAEYGTIRNLSSEMDVHHVMDRLINTKNCLRFVQSDYHMMYHSQSGNHSRRSGVVINSYQELLEFIEKVKKVDACASVLPM